MPSYDFTDRTAQFDAEEGDSQELADGSGNGNNLRDNQGVPGGQTGIIGDARGIIRSGNQHFRQFYAASGPWDVRGLTSCTFAGWFKVLNTEQQHVFIIDDPLAVLANKQAFHMILRETNTSTPASPWIFMGDGLTRFVGASLKPNAAVEVSTGIWQFLAGGYNKDTNKLFGYWGKAAGVSYYKEVTGVVGGFGYLGTGSEAMIGKFNGEAGNADMHVDHCLWWNGRALTEAELDIVWNDHAALSFDDLTGFIGLQAGRIISATLTCRTVVSKTV